MKVSLTSLITALATTAMAQAFTIDFNSLTAPDGSDLTGATVTPGSPLVIAVPGYGSVRFEVGVLSGHTLEVDNTYSNDGGTTFQNSLELDLDETVVVTFLGPEAINVNFDIIGISATEDATPVQNGINPGEEFQLSVIGGAGDDGAGIAAISWDAVPEPSSSLMILLGTSSLLLRRKRG